MVTTTDGILSLDSTGALVGMVFGGPRGSGGPGYVTSIREIFQDIEAQMGYSVEPRPRMAVQRRRESIPVGRLDKDWIETTVQAVSLGLDVNVYPTVGAINRSNTR